MNLLFMVILSMILFIYGGLTYYIGLRGWQFVVASGLKFSAIGYWISLWFVAFSFFIARGGARWLPNWLSDFFEVIGAYWLGIMTYLTMILFLVEVAGLLNRRLHFIPEGLISQPKFIVTIGIVVISLVCIIVSYGWWSGRNPEIVQYEVQLDKEMEGFQELNIVMLSDLHLGRLVNRRQLERVVEKVNHLNADLVLMPGDIIDDRVDAFVEQNMMEVFQKLSPPLGVYASMGNHEYIGGQAEMAEKYLQQTGIHVLRDGYVKIADAFYVVGREDKAYERFQRKSRKPLKELLAGVDKKMPIIMLDHQPVDFAEAEKEGVDIQLSGHTHRGQLFPFRLFTRKMFEVDWGYEKIGNLHIIVTSGAGTWGPPMRVGHRSEIVYTRVQFQ
ncbi:metallophosphoesterase [Clostridium formicaceticum]|uniref:Metallophosphoesterase n=1 Tax=Clostridium formicaceticum TaxID=1497 RepID=A0AAC9WH02_9CLOT|nr:metallophosphoesterase [Clostridium formicaceticum]AOY77737.1 hypothetical protein BJL90_18870 [Clostridium formicaceticum]ARE88334.1 putative metallophosphoesterase [Clostridium formicaceticum]